MKEAFKKYWLHLVLLLVINIPILVLCITRTNNYLILKGGTTPFSSIVTIDSPYEEKGSFSTIYVINMNRSTIFQNMIADVFPNVEKQKIGKYSTHISNRENNLAGYIQYQSSISKSISLAYSEAKKYNSEVNIDYSLESYQVTWYGPKSSLRIGDKIIEVNGYKPGSPEFYNKLGDESTIGVNIDDELKVLRDGKELTIRLKKYDVFSGYYMYDINMETLSPALSINPQSVGGPSGGFLQTLSIFNRLISEDITHGLKIAGTGTISIDGRVGMIGGIKEKVPTAFDEHIDIFLCADSNYDEALVAYNKIPNHDRMKLVRINTFYDALDYLMEGYENDFK